MVDVINGSSGRSYSTEHKFPDFIFPGNYGSGFGLRLQVKDMRIALELARATGVPVPFTEASVELWERAMEALPGDADHTEIARWVESAIEARADG
jgi:3-hydroxyisobutyrate dehydrogenase